MKLNETKIAILFEILFCISKVQLINVQFYCYVKPAKWEKINHETQKKGKRQFGVVSLYVIKDIYCLTDSYWTNISWFADKNNFSHDFVKQIKLQHERTKGRKHCISKAIYLASRIRSQGSERASYKANPIIFEAFRKGL